MATTPTVPFLGAAELEHRVPESASLDGAAEETALRRAKAGDADAFAHLVRAHQRSVYGLAVRALRNRMEAEDVAQDVFLQLHLRLDRIESSRHLAFWLRRTVSHRVIDRLRRRCRNPEIGADPAAVQPPDVDCLLVQRLEERVAELPDVPRLVVALRYQEDLDPAEIARLLDLSVNTVKSHLKRSLARLRAQCTGRDPL
jgi:RNA polymerase sigma-70 factor, ECF subfamily